MKFQLVVLALFSVLVLPAQQGGVARKGLLFGWSTGAALLNPSGSGKEALQTGPALNWKIGYVLNPRWAVLLNGAVSIYDNATLGRQRKRDFGGVFPSAQYWPGKRCWLMGGAGLGTDAPVFYDLKPGLEGETKYYTGWGTAWSAGYELYQRKNKTIDVQARFAYSRVNLPAGPSGGMSSGLLVGINFY